MRNRKKGWTAGVSALLAVTMLAGCNSGTDGGSGAADGNKSAGEAENKPLTIKMFAGLYNEVPDMNNVYWKEWEKRTNAKLDVEWVPSGDLNNKLDLLLASGDLPEVVAYQDNNRPTLVNAIKNGAFWDLTPFLGDLSEYPNLKNNLAKDALKYLTVDGKIYAVPRSRSRVDGGIKIRKDWLDKLNIPVPKTLDEYEAALKKIVDSDMDGNGKKDTVGLLYINDPVASFQAAFGVLDPKYNDEGGFISPRLTPQYTEMVAWFRKLYAEGLMSKEYAVMKESQAEELFKTNRAASYGRPIWWDNDWENAMKKSGQPDAKILNLHLKGPGGDAVALETGVAGGYYISKKVPEAKVKQLLAYFEKTASQEMTDFAYYGLPDIHHTVVNGQMVLTEQGVKEVNTTSKGAGVLAYAKWGKVISASGDKAYNDDKIKEVEIFDEIGKIDPYRIISSDAWISTWPKYEAEFKSMMTKAIVGQISMDEYKAHVEKLNNLPDMKKAYLDMAAAYKQFAQ
ncbi:extracellular solute-binding protein [Paenibacillus puerhi]|uniref:extracellular solute-binding protein n=1 Tax=Paenibacillus puerhi TaxID=2692622 RepID=UPI001358147F|nr:extracellular solute-binding protein [Paenibacillus puerhi]